MRAVLPIGEGSEPGRPRLGELPDPRAAAGEVLVAVRATALNQADLLQLRGLYPPPPGESAVPGLECSGVVAAVGDGVEGVAEGDRVMALLAGGGHASRAVVPVGQLMTVPASLDLIAAAAIPEAALTAWTNLVVEGGLHQGQSVLISGAASGVGTMAVQVARELGARVLAAGRTLERLERLRPLGADELCLLDETLPQTVREITGGEGVDLILDLVGGGHVPRHLEALKSRGRLVLVGLLAGRRCELDLGEVLRRRLRIVGSVLRGRSRGEKTGLVAGFMDFATPRLDDGRLRPVVDRVVPFDAILEAYEALGAGGVFGKVVIQVEAE